MRLRKGFTLIELLVVIAIIALLMSIVMPVLRKVKEQARRTVCSSNLRQWGITMQNYMSDNNEELLKSVDTWTLGEEPFITWLSNKCVPRANKEFNLDAIGPYMPGFDFDNNEMGDIWLCPSNTMDYKAMTKYHKENCNFIVMQYSYIARVDLWKDGVATCPKQLTGKTLSAQKVLLSDACFKYSATGGWLYNHGVNGPSVHRDDVDFGGIVNRGIPEITGLNRCYGDGSVQWRPVDKYYDPILMNSPTDETQPRIMSDNTMFY